MHGSVKDTKVCLGSAGALIRAEGVVDSTFGCVGSGSAVLISIPAVVESESALGDNEVDLRGVLVVFSIPIL